MFASHVHCVALARVTLLVSRIQSAFAHVLFYQYGLVGANGVAVCDGQLIHAVSASIASNCGRADLFQIPPLMMRFCSKSRTMTLNADTLFCYFVHVLQLPALFARDTGG